MANRAFSKTQKKSPVLHRCRDCVAWNATTFQEAILCSPYYLAPTAADDEVYRAICQAASGCKEQPPPPEQ